MKRQRVDESKYNYKNNVQLKQFNYNNNDITTTNNSTLDKHQEIEQVLYEIQHLQQQQLSIDDITTTKELLTLLLWKLREFGLSSNGYCNDTIRQKVYPILILGLNYDQLLQQQQQQQQQERSVGGETLCEDDNDYYLSLSTIHQHNDSLLATKYGSGKLQSQEEQEHYNIHHHQDYEQIQLDVVRNAWEHLKVVQPPLNTITFDNDDEYELGVEERKKLLSSFIDVTLQTPIQKSNNCSSQQEQLYSNVWVNNKQLTKESTLQQQQQQQQQQPQHALRYYQGYHDVASIILSIMMATTTTTTVSNESDSTTNDNDTTSTGTAVTPASIVPTISSFLQDAIVSSTTTTSKTQLSQLMLHRLSITHLQDYMTDSFTRLQTIMNISLRPLLWKLDIDLYNHLFLFSQEEEQQSFLFSISWILTWFCHDLLKPKQQQQQQYSSSTSNQQVDLPIDIVKRLFDFFIVSHPTMPLYVTIAMMLHPTNKQYLLECCDPTDYSNKHSIMSQIPYNLTMNSNNNINDCGNDQQHIDPNEEVSHHSMGNNNNYWQVFPLVDDAASDTSASDDDYQVLIMDDYMPSTCIKNHNDQMKQLTPSNRDDEKDIVLATTSTLLQHKYTKTAFQSHRGRRFCNTTVPIDEIIQLSISFMNTIPPYKLVDLAQEHYGSDCPNVQDWLQVLPTITTTFQPLDITTSFVTNSCVTEQQQQQQPQHEALLVSESTSLVHSTIQDCTSPHDVAPLATNMLLNIIEENSTAVAIIAAGYGVCTLKQSSQRKKWYLNMFSALRIRKKIKQRIIMVTSMILVFILAYVFLIQPVLVTKNKLHDHIPIVVIPSVPEVEEQEQSTDITSIQNDTVLVTENLNHDNLVTDYQEVYPYDENDTIADVRKLSVLQTTSNSNRIFLNLSTDEIQPHTADFSSEVRHVEAVMMNQPPHELPVTRIESSRMTNSNDHYSCIVAGLPAQLLCLVDGSQLCRPIRSDGIVNLLDLSMDDVVSYTPCQQEPEPRDIQVPFNSKNVQLKSSNGSSLRCPIEFASCGNYDSSLLICNLNRSSTNEVKSERNDKRRKSRHGSELCVKADRVSSTLLEVVVPIVPDNENRDLTSWKQDRYSFDASSHICGCCDGFDPNIDSAGVCIDNSSSTITAMLSKTASTNSWLGKKDCCHPCRPQVPIEYRPCCCFHTNQSSWNKVTIPYDVRANNITTTSSTENCFSDDAMYGYENCVTSML